jgi:hypothetical protein
MPQVYRVKLADGSVIGPLDRDALQSWFENGLIVRDTPTQLEGGTRWTPLEVAVEIRGWRSSQPSTPSRSTPSRARQPQAGARSGSRSTPAPAPAYDDGASSGRRNLILAGGAALLVVAGIAGWWLTRGSGAIARPASAERRIEAPELDLALDLPAGWVLLTPGETAPVVPPDARWTLAEESAHLTAYVAARPHAAGDGAGTLEPALQSFQRLAPGFTPDKRETAHVGERDVQLCEGKRPASGGPEWVRIMAWRDGWQDFALVAWAPEKQRGVAALVENLLRGISHPGGVGRLLDLALRLAATEVPHLDRNTAERLMQASGAQILEPPDLLRRSYERLGRGLGALSPSEKSELTALHGALYASLGGADRQRLASYVDRARERQPLTASDDKAILPLLRTAVGKLQPARRVRLQQLFAKAIAAAGPK